MYNILHLAMHAIANDSISNRSALYFAPTHQGNDDLLSSEIYNLRLNALLVVLSACNTGDGKHVSGEGIMSLAHAFRFAGCRNIVTSLWQVDDESAGIIMKSFYKHLKRGVGKDEALRLSRIDYLSKSGKSHPFFWSSFVLIGDDLPVDFAGQSNFEWHIFGGLLLILILILWSKRKKMFTQVQT